MTTIYITSDISTSTTWTSGNIYVISSGVTINCTANLIIDNGATFDNYGTFNANPTSASLSVSSSGIVNNYSTGVISLTQIIFPSSRYSNFTINSDGVFNNYGTISNSGYTSGTISIAGIFYANNGSYLTNSYTTNLTGSLYLYSGSTFTNGINFSGTGTVYQYYGSNYTAAGTVSNTITFVYVDYPNYPCFKEGSQILTNNGYVVIQNLRKGDLIQTSKDSFKPIYKIGKKNIHNPCVKERVKHQLYKCSKDEYSELFEDLIITGCHSILVDKFTSKKQKEDTLDLLGDIYVTDAKYRLPACLDERASVYEEQGQHTIYHLALENEHYYGNYGIFANGLLVESCTKNYIDNHSEMTMIE